MMTLYTSPASPFARKVRALVVELGLQQKVREIAASGSAIAPGSMPVDQNPLGKIPTLLRADGAALYDSRVICRYLDDHARGGLYPTDRLWDVLTLEATADGIMDAALLMVYEARLRPEDKRFADWVEGQWTKVARALVTLDKNWIVHLNGPVDMGQIALACALGYLDFRLDSRGWREGRPKLAAWQAAFALRPSIEATVPVS